MKNITNLIYLSFGFFTFFIAQSDSTQTTESNDMISPIHYRGDSKYTYKNSDGDYITVCTGNASLIYQDMKLEAHEIEIHQSTFMVYAKGKTDTLEDGKLEYIGLPKFSEAGTEPMYAERMEYDFKNRRGRVFEGKTVSDKTRYQGKEIRKFGEKTILIRDGKFTTCEEDTPSYWFHSSQIRMLQNDMVFTGPVFMHLHQIPFPIPLPFGVFSLKKGKRSGVEIPSFDFFSSNFKGNGLSDYGYYWAASEQFQATILGSYYENTGLDWKLNTEFRDRYNYSGNINFSYLKSPLDISDPKPSETRNNFNLNFNYKHKIDPSFDISASGNFKSSNTDSRVYKTLEKQLDQNLSSSFNLKKRWGENNNNLSVNTRYSDNLITKDRSLTLNTTNSWTKSKNSLTINASNSWNSDKKTHSENLPSLSFTHQSRELLPASDPLNAKWYNNIRYSYSSKFTETSNITSTLTDSIYIRNEEIKRRGLEHTPSISISGLKVLKYISVQPSIQYKETWVDKIGQIDHSIKDKNGNDTLVVKEVGEFAALRQYNVGVTLNTNLYGMFEPNLFGLKAVRHKLSPSIDFRYNPDFRQNKYGNGEYVRGTDGSDSIFVDKFQFSPYSKTPTGEALNANIRVQNTFTAKTTDEKGEDKKVDLFSLGMSTSVNFLDHDNTRWSDLSTSLTVPSTSYLSFSGSAVHSFYELDRTDGKKIGTEFVSPILKTASFRSTLSLKKNLFGTGNTLNKVSKDTSDSELDIVKSDLKGKSLAKKVEYLKGFKLDWDLRVNANYTYIHYTTGKNVVTTYDGTFNTKIDLTTNWKLKYNLRYDLKEAEIKYHRFEASRDLGCWTFDFFYEPNEYNPRYGLTIAIKEDMLEDLKYERKSSGY